MLIPGHLAAGVLAVAVATPAHRRPRFGTELGPTLLGVLTPDLIDKPLFWLGVFADGRVMGHSVAFLGLAGLVWGGLWMRNQRSAWLVRMWALGVAAHLVADLADDTVHGLIRGSVTVRSWFGWPFSTTEWRTLAVQESPWFDLGWITPIEVATIAAATWVVYRWRDRPTAPVEDLEGPPAGLAPKRRRRSRIG